MKLINSDKEQFINILAEIMNSRPILSTANAIYLPKFLESEAVTKFFNENKILLTYWNDLVIVIN